MSDLMINLRRSPRKLLERDGHPGPGPGRLALVLARAGVGKTAFLVDIGLDALLAGQKVLHVSLESTVEKVRTWYDDVLTQMLASEKKLEHWAPIQIDVERRRHIHTYVDHSFTVERLRHGVDLLRDVMSFVPQVILVDDLEREGIDAATIAAVKGLAEEVGAELWIACKIYRDGPQGEPGHLPPPADELEDLVDLAFRLDPHDAKIRLHVLKDRERMLDEDLHVVLDPRTMLLNVGFGGG
jgi:hypothetical protein